jgi:membrane protease YdiL (CAAX protease family)
MATAIGRSLVGSRSRLALAGLVGGVVVTGEEVLVAQVTPPLAIPAALAMAALPAALAVVILLPLARWDRASLGLTFAPQQGWGYWCRLTALLAPVVGGLMVVGAGLRWVVTGDSQIIRLPPEMWGEEFVISCLAIPPIEELIYRLAVCVPTAVLLRPAAVIAASGLLFGLAHVLAGVASTNHFLVGFFLAWAYLKSGSVVVPIALHGLGNLWVVGMEIGAWSLFNGVPA